ncbi:hypothetical protein pb186bvf_009821 [Paramecium bursaria]
MQQEYSQEVIGSTVILKTIKPNPQFMEQISEKQDLNFSQISFFESNVDKFQGFDRNQMSIKELDQYQEIESQLDQMEIDQIKKYFKEFVMRLQDQEQIIKRQELQLQTYCQSIWCHNSINEKYEKIKISQQELEASNSQIRDLNITLQQCQNDIVFLNKQLQQKDSALKAVFQTNQQLQQKIEAQELNHNQELEIYKIQINDKDQEIEILQKQFKDQQLQVVELTLTNENLIKEQKNLEQKLKQCNSFIQDTIKIQCKLVHQKQIQEDNQKQKKNQNNSLQIISFILQYIRRSQRNFKLILQAKKHIEESNLIIEQLKFVIQKQKEQIKLKEKESLSQQEQLSEQKSQIKQLQNKIISQVEQFATQTEQIDKLSYEIKQYQNCLLKFEDSTKGDISLIFKNHLNYFYLSILQIKSIDKFLTHQFIHDMHKYAGEFNIKLHESNSPFKFQIYVLGK